MTGTTRMAFRKAATAAAFAKANANNLLSNLVPPSKLASNLDWRKASGASVLTLNIHTDRIGLRLGHHPSSGRPSQSLDDLPLSKKGKISSTTHQQLSSIIESHNVCGFVVNWPIQHDTGRLGYAAGRVLYTLEQLLKESQNNNNNSHNNAVLLKNVCLWDGQHVVTSQSQTDQFGRNPSFGYSGHDATTATAGAPPTDGTHTASVQQYHEDEMVVAKQIWDDFVKTQWPEIYQHNIEALGLDENDDGDTADVDISVASATSPVSDHHNFDHRQQEQDGIMMMMAA